MTNAHSLPDYKERYFEYKELLKVHGKPTLGKIIKVWRQLKRNAQRIPTTLGGGNHGYLALLIIANRLPKYSKHYSVKSTGLTRYISSSRY